MIRTHVTRPVDVTPVTGRSVADAVVDERSAIGLQTFDRVTRTRTMRVLGGLVVHDLRALIRELDHLGQRRALESFARSGTRRGSAVIAPLTSV